MAVGAGDSLSIYLPFRTQKQIDIVSIVILSVGDSIEK